MGLPAGKLDRRITLQRFTSASDTGSGEQVKTWATLGPSSISASHRRASARETIASAELAAAASDVFEIRWDSAWSDLSPLDRLLFNSVVHEIVAVAEIGRREGLRVDTVVRGDQ